MILNSLRIPYHPKSCVSLHPASKPMTVMIIYFLHQKRKKWVPMSFRCPVKFRGWRLMSLLISMCLTSDASLHWFHDCFSPCQISPSSIIYLASLDSHISLALVNYMSINQFIEKTLITNLNVGYVDCVPIFYLVSNRLIVSECFPAIVVQEFVQLQRLQSKLDKINEIKSNGTC